MKCIIDLLEIASKSHTDYNICAHNYEIEKFLKSKLEKFLLKHNQFHENSLNICTSLDKFRFDFRRQSGICVIALCSKKRNSH